MQLKLEHAENNNDADQIGILHERLNTINGYGADARANQLLNGLGFSSSEVTNPVDYFSGGWRMRLNLARALMCRSDLLLLDEPTNHLDLDAVIWLESWLKYFPGTLLLISHDRSFLDNVVESICCIEGGSLKTYKGNYSAFEVQRASHLAQEKATYVKQQREVEHRRRGALGVAQIKRHRDRAADDQCADHLPGQEAKAGDRAPERKAGAANAGQDQAGEIEALRMVAADLLDVALSEQDADEADRNVDQEDPVPGQVLHHPAAHGRAEQRAEQAGDGD